MPITKQFTVDMIDQPGTLGTFCRALADRGVNILAFSSFPLSGKSTVRFVVDNPTTAKTAMDGLGTTYTETQVAQVKLPHTPGELARAASKLGEASINIDYVYGGVEPGTNVPLLIFGVADVTKAASILDEVAAKAAA